MPEPARGRRDLRLGTALLAVLGVAAATAPLVATDLPWVAKGPDGLSFPALRSAFGRSPRGHDPAARPWDATPR